MSVFLIVLERPNPTAFDKLNGRWKEYTHTINETSAFVAPPGIVTTGEVKETIGISLDENTPNGIVVEISGAAYDGTMRARTIDWINSAEERK